jgi:flagellin-like hook-associated protein FlgL
MIYRTAHRATYRNINDNLGLVSYRIAQLTNQAATERRINTPSDDPTGAARVLGTRSTLSAINQYRTNLSVSDLWLSESGNAAQSVKEVLDNIYTLTEQAATDTYSDSQREAILTEVEGWFQQLLQNGNTKIGDSYIFSGQKVNTQSFAAQVEAHKVRAGCQNSTAWTGKVVNWGSPVFNNRPDLPVQSQDFLIEVVQAGGVDSRWFSTPSKLAGATINGGQVTTGSPMGWEAYNLSLRTTDARYNDYQIRFVAGTANQTSTGSAARNNGLSFSAGAFAYVLAQGSPPYTGPVTVNYVLGGSWAEARAAAASAAGAAAYASALTSAHGAGLYSAAAYASAVSAANGLFSAAVHDHAVASGYSEASATAVAYATAISAGLFDISVYWASIAGGLPAARAADAAIDAVATINYGYTSAISAGLFSAQAFNTAIAAGLSHHNAVECAMKAAATVWAQRAWQAAYDAEPAARAAYEGSGVVTVTLLTDGEHPPGSVASAGAVLAALKVMASAEGWNSAASAFSHLAWGEGWMSAVTIPPDRYIADWSFFFKLTDSPPNTGCGKVGPGSITFNDTEVRAEVKNGQVTVYLPRANDPDGRGDFTASVSAVAAALNKLVDPCHTDKYIFTAEATAGADLIFQPSAAWVPLATSQPYTLAHATLSPKGTQNDLIWSVRNNGNKFEGAAGNQLSVQYVLPTGPDCINPVPKLVFNSATGLVTVHAAGDINIYNNIYAKVFYETGSKATAHEKAIAAAVTTTANDVKAMVNGTAAFPAEYEIVSWAEGSATAHREVLKSGAAAQKAISCIFEVSLADGNSGDGRLNIAHPRTYLADGYNQPALFRVSQDGGKTWGPPQSFGASEYQVGDMFHNAFLGHASLTTNIPGQANDLVFTARYQGTWGNDLRVEYQLPDRTSHPNPATTVTVGPNPWNVCVTLRTDAQGRVLSTAKEVMEAVNNHPVASQLVLADLANYHEGGDGVVDLMKCTSLAVGPPYQVTGKSVITPLGYATATVSFPYSAPSQSDPNIIFQATAQGAAGNKLGIRYTTSADPTRYASASAANNSYQAETTVRYETDPKTHQTVLVVHLGTEVLPSCPDGTIDPNAAAGWREKFPLYSCTSSRAVTTTAGDVLKAVVDYNTAHPDQALVWPQFERYPEGWDSTAKVGPTDGIVWLKGGENPDSAEQHGVNLKFIPDGTALRVGDVFEVPVGWYRGDDKNMDVNLDSNTRGALNTTGTDLLGGNGAGDNILDTVQRLMFALKQNDTEAIGRELPKVKAAIEKVATLESKIGTKQIRNKFVAHTLDQKQFGAETLLSSIEDVDFSKLITDLKNAQTVYEALLGVTGLTTTLSLLSFIV